MTVAVYVARARDSWMCNSALIFQSTHELYSAIDHTEREFTVFVTHQHLITWTLI